VRRAVVKPRELDRAGIREEREKLGVLLGLREGEFIVVSGPDLLALIAEAVQAGRESVGRGDDASIRLRHTLRPLRRFEAPLWPVIDQAIADVLEREIAVLRVTRS
jgi:hypothetical protein